MDNTVKCKSGLIGWQGRLRDNYYDDFRNFQNYCEMYAIHSRLGFKTPTECWLKNPMIRGSVNPSDLEVVKKRPMKRTVKNLPKIVLTFTEFTV